MSKCKKVNNACKICLQTVKPKAGLQCQGACESWVHYSCLNYTPGKIKDIQTGVITVTCPCPDCKTTVPKEIRTNQPFSCNNYKCPANKAPACEEATCQANEVTYSRPPPPHFPGALLTCGHDCRNFMMPNTFPSQPSDPCMEGFPVSGKSSDASRPGQLSSAQASMGVNMAAVQQMCNTVGELTNQLNTLMTTMKQAAMAADAQGGGGVFGGGAIGGQQPCTQKGPRALCPKPCNCPGNPQRRL